MAYNSFEESLDTLLICASSGRLVAHLAVLSYWLAIYSVILLEEHFIFRRGSFANCAYTALRPSDPSRRPLGVRQTIAAPSRMGGCLRVLLRCEWCCRGDGQHLVRRASSPQDQRAVRGRYRASLARKLF